MVWKAEELPSRLRVASAVGKRTDREATDLIQRTPAMATGISDHRWTMQELMIYPIIK